MNIMNKKLIWTNYAFTLHLRPVVLLVVVVLLVALLVLVAETLVVVTDVELLDKVVELVMVVSSSTAT